MLTKLLEWMMKVGVRICVLLLDHTSAVFLSLVGGWNDGHKLGDRVGAAGGGGLQSGLLTLAASMMFIARK